MAAVALTFQYLKPWAKNRNFAENRDLVKYSAFRKEQLESHIKMNKTIVFETQSEIDQFHPANDAVPVLRAYKNLRIAMIAADEAELIFVNNVHEASKYEVVVKRKCVGADAIARETPLPHDMVKEIMKFL